MLLKSVRLAAISYLLCFPSIALAGFEEALAAYQAKNFPKAIAEARLAADAGDARASFLMGTMYQGGQGVSQSSTEAVTWYEKAAKGGVIGSFSKLAQIYMRGGGSVKDPEKALAFARQSARLGDPEGMFLVHIILKANSLSYLDANQKPDQAKYWKLASRSIPERTLDVEAQDALYRATEKGYPLGILSLALTLGGTVGEENLSRMLSLVAKIPKHTNKALHNYEKIARHIKTQGQSLTSPQLFLDAQVPQMMVATIRTCGLGKTKEEKLPPPKLIATAIAKPLVGASYLPSTVPSYEHAYLVAGEWEEDWTYQGCDKTATVRVKFIADGLGGARFVSEQVAKDAPVSSLQK